MSLSNEPQSFLDPKTIAAIVLVGACWLGWQAYMQKKYPHIYNKNSVKPLVEKSEGSDSGLSSSVEGLNPKQTKSGLGELRSGELEPVEQLAEEAVMQYNSDELSFELSSVGMGFNKISLGTYTKRDLAPISHVAVGDIRPFETRLIGQENKLNFLLERVNNETFLGRAQWGQLTITKLIEVNSEDYTIKTKVGVEGKGTPFLGLRTLLVDRLIGARAGSFLLPQFEKQEFFAVSAESESREVIENARVENSHKGVSVAAIGDQYFAQAIVDRSQVIPDLITNSDDQTKVASAQISYPSMNKSDGFEIEYIGFVGPKYLRLLEKVDPELPALIDYGFFSWLSRPILHLLTWFFSITKNWGLAIIVLTLFVRLLVMPLYVMSFRSMNKMKLIQPELTRLREKFKDDPTRMNQEVMSLMKNNKVNPLGGCLPMLLQFPVFIALYSVLGQSIELYQAPFLFWIKDLSLKDPYYVFPVLMGVTMFLQQKLTPTTLDPVQAKIFLVMPVIFSFFMFNLPSGLTLYIFVSALFGVVQQLVFMKDQPKQLAVAVKA